MPGEGATQRSGKPGEDVAALLEAALRSLRSGRVESALELFQTAIARDAGSAPARNGLGVALCLASRPQEALAQFAHAIALQADFAHAHANRGNALRALGRHREAVDSYQRALDIGPELPAICHFQGLSFLQMGLPAQALHCFDRSIARDPNFADAYLHRGACCIDLGRFEQALESLDRAVALDPANAIVFNDRGVALMGCRRPAEALASFERAVQLRAGYATAHAGRATALSQLGRLAEAIGAYELAASLAPERAQTHSDLAAALIKANRLDAALQSCERALACQPDLADAYWNRSQVRLLQGSMAAGWADFEHRLRMSGSAGSRHAAVPRWTGESPLAGRRILLWSEQGIGDTLQFCRYVPVVRSLGGEVVLQVQAAVKPVLAGLEAVAAIFADDEPVGPCDLQCPLMSLPLAIRAWRADIPADVPYLSADARKSAAWRARLGSGRKIGLVCSGNPAHRNDANRSIALSLFAPLFGDARFLLLQKEVRAADESWIAKFAIEDLRADLLDLGDTAAVIDNLDLVICVDTAVAHLAGALGKPLWLLLPWVPDWRWQLGRDDSPWYPTARLFRQPRANDWASVMEQVRAALAQWPR
jgi:tetratricopeptide (TPR) repeat protein